MSRRSLMFVLAHPDDETFGPGGTIAKYAREGARISVIIATSGQAGRRAGLASTPEELGRVREAEARAAAEYLGVSTVHFFGYTDGELDQADETEVKEKVVRLIRQERPDVVVTFGPEGAGNEHRDHKRISRIATAAVASAADPDVLSDEIEAGLAPHLVKKFYYMSGRETPWREMSKPFMPITTAIDISDFVETKLEAFKLHRSQQEWTDRLKQWISSNQNTEAYHRASSVVTGLPEIENDLFAGLD
ncbi:MAG TPA: PIG-L family deacetylase [Blastocatellia bacterium]|nr:PIG-L family deacetylase [Blastocatellia bacterium]